MTGRLRPILTLALAVGLIAVGAAQPIGLVLAFSRFVDPGAATFDAIGATAGFGMATVAAAVTLFSPSRRPRLVALLGAAATAAGLVSMSTWLSLSSRTFYTNDAPRIAVLAATDIAFTVWIVAAARYAGKEVAAPQMPPVAWVMTLRVVLEILLFGPVIMPSSTNPGASGNVFPIFAGGVVLLGYLVLGLWEIAVGLWLRRA